MGLALSSCTVPAAGCPGFTLAETEIEPGLGIHGEPGVRRGPLEPADVLVGRLLDAVLVDLALAPGARVVLVINNLGATPTMELAVARDNHDMTGSQHQISVPADAALTGPQHRISVPADAALSPPRPDRRDGESKGGEGLLTRG
jgi:dihydroxyacetone kinase